MDSISTSAYGWHVSTSRDIGFIMANGPRSIYSRRQRMAPGQYDNPLADFLDNLPGYVNQFQRNQLELGKQQLADKRYEDDKAYRDERVRVEDKRYEEAQRVARANKKEEQNKYRRQVKRQEAEDREGDVERIISRIPKYDYKSHAKVYESYGMDAEADAVRELANNQSSTLNDLRGKVSRVQNLGPNATFYDYDAIRDTISPEDFTMLSEVDKRAYNALSLSDARFDSQRKTGMRKMSDQDKSDLNRARSQVKFIETEMIKVAQKMPNMSGMGKNEILEALKATGAVQAGELTQLKDQLNIFEAEVDEINSRYRITPPRTPENIIQGGVDIPGMKYDLADMGVIPTMPNVGRGASTFVFEDPKTETAKVPETVNEAIEEEDRINSMYILASAPEGSSEYKTAEQKLEAFNKLKELEPITPTVREAMTKRGKTGESGFKLRPESKLAKSTPTNQSPKYYDRLLKDLSKEQSVLAKNPELNPVRANKILEREDEIVTNLQLAIDSMPNTQEYGKTKQKYRNYLKKYLRSGRYQRTFKGNRVMGTRYDPRTGMGFLPQEGELEKIYAELYGGRSSTPIQDILNIGGAMASPSGEIGVTPQPIQLFE
jgi:hypothetical protein